MNFIHAIAADSLRSVMEDNHQHFIRKVLRWYSRTFHTPLHQAEELPLEYVLRAWFETYFEDLGEDERVEKARFLIESPEERLAREQEAEADEDSFLAEVAAEAIAAKAKKSGKEAPLTDTQPVKPDQLISPEDLEVLKNLPEIDMKFEVAPEGNLETNGLGFPTD